MGTDIHPLSYDGASDHNPCCLCGHLQTKHRYDVGFTKCRAMRCDCWRFRMAEPQEEPRHE